MRQLPCGLTQSDADWHCTHPIAIMGPNFSSPRTSLCRGIIFLGGIAAVIIARPSRPPTPDKRVGGIEQHDSMLLPITARRHRDARPCRKRYGLKIMK